MSTFLDQVFDYADAEFQGKSFNGPSLMATLRDLSAEAAASTATYEGYCAWEVAHHLAYYKFFILKSLGLSAELEPYPFSSEDLDGPPADKSESAWKADLEYIEKCHNVTWKVLRNLPATQLEAVMPEWKVSYGKAIAWLMSHDAYHIGQIRSMGVPGLRTLKP